MRARIKGETDAIRTRIGREDLSGEAARTSWYFKRALEDYYDFTLEKQEVRLG